MESVWEVSQPSAATTDTTTTAISETLYHARTHTTAVPVPQRLLTTPPQTHAISLKCKM